MPGVFLYAHAINQIINGYYHHEINDEWRGFSGENGLSMAELESLMILLLEIIFTCLVLYGAKFLFRKKERVKLNVFIMGLTAAALMIGLALIPLLFGLANIAMASLVFIALAARQRPPTRL
jgi:nitric oxide reductase large subunit